jgi:hypothetical protein
MPTRARPSARGIGGSFPQHGWEWLNGYSSDASYVRGHALVHVTCVGEGTRASLILSADHDER